MIDYNRNLGKSGIFVSTQDLIISSLEIAAERSGDITPAVYDIYFENSPGSRELMAHVDHLVRGKMLEEVMRLLMVEDMAVEDQYLTFEMKTHEESYSVIESMYASLLQAVWQVVREGTGEEWNAAYETAWQERVASLHDEIKNHSPASVERDTGRSGEG
jgi:hypothetical protein